MPSRPAEEGGVALATNARETLVFAEPVEDDPGQLLLGSSQLLAGTHAFGFRKPSLDDLLLASLDGEVGLREGDGVLRGVAFWAIR